jgi:uncharacterized protein YuzE
MKLQYDPKTDSLYIELAGRPAADSREISEGVVLDYDNQGILIGIDIDNASRKLDLTEFSISRLPSETIAVPA